MSKRSESISYLQTSGAQVTSIPARLERAQIGECGAMDASEASALLLELQSILDVVSVFRVLPKRPVAHSGGTI
jgi:hypothetical protein